jgi:hypothetical protein
MYKGFSCAYSTAQRRIGDPEVKSIHYKPSYWMEISLSGPLHKFRPDDKEENLSLLGTQPRLPRP